MKIRGVFVDSPKQIRIGEVLSRTNYLPSVVFADFDRSLGVLGLECHGRNNEGQICAGTRSRLKSESLTKQRDTAKDRYFVVRDRVANCHKTAQDQAVAAGNPG